MAHPGISYSSSVPQPLMRPLSQRLLIEILMTIAVAALMLVALFSFQEKSMALDSNSLVSYGIDAGSIPFQNDVPLFSLNLEYDNSEAVLTGGETYSISARAWSTREYSDSISDIVPYDMLLAWGDMADDEAGDQLSWTQSDRKGQVSGMLGGSDGFDVSSDYVVTHVSNNHLVPANDRIREALSDIEPGDMIRIQGRLVDIKVYTGDGHAYTMSTSRNRADQGDGACEIIYVESLKINENSY